MIAPADRALIRLYWPVALRPAFDALLGIDDAMAEVVRTSTEPALGAIRLAWWREALERLDCSAAPAEPHLQAAAAELLPRGISGAALAGLEDGWPALLGEAPWGDDVAAAVATRGERLFAIGAKLLGAEDLNLASAGATFALADAARRASDRDSADRLVTAARSNPAHRFAKPLRPLTALTALARRDLAAFPGREEEGTPGRAITLIGHRLMGRA